MDNLKGHTILLVDDEPDILEFLSYNLKKEGFKVFSANNGEDGRISWATIRVPGSRSVSRKRANAKPVWKAKSGVISVSTKPRMSYALKTFDVGTLLTI